jgi:hypothetical protein
MKAPTSFVALMLFVALTLLAAAGLVACSSGRATTESLPSTSSSDTTTTMSGTSATLPSTSTSSLNTSTSTPNTSTSVAGDAAANQVLAKAVSAVGLRPMDAEVPGLFRGVRTVYSFGRDGWTAQSFPQGGQPAGTQVGPQAGAKGDMYFLLQSFEGTSRIVTATTAEMERMSTDKTLFWSGAGKGATEFLIGVLLDNPLEQLKHMDTMGLPVALPNGGQRIQGTVMPLDLVRPQMAMLGADWERTHPDAWEFWSATIKITLDVDRDGTPTRMEMQSDAVIDGHQVPLVTVQWQMRASQPEFPLADSLPLATVVAEPWPTDWMPSYKIAAPQSTAASVAAYIKQQRKYLTEAIEQLGDAQMRGLVTFKEPLDGATAASTVGTNNLRIEYLEWETEDGQRGRSSAFVAKTAEAVREVFFPDKESGYVRLVAVGLIGSHRDYVGISRNPKVLCVDLGPVPQLIPLIKKAKSVIGQPTRGLYWIWKAAGSPTA